MCKYIYIYPYVYIPTQSNYCCTHLFTLYLPYYFSSLSINYYLCLFVFICDKNKISYSPIKLIYKKYIAVPSTASCAQVISIISLANVTHANANYRLVKLWQWVKRVLRIGE